MRETLSELVARRLNELSLSKADLAAATRLSRTYITDIANGTGNTQSGQYRPSPEVVSRLSEVLQVNETEILNAIGYTLDPGSKIPEPILAAYGTSNYLSPNDNETIATFIKGLNEQRAREAKEKE